MRGRGKRTYKDNGHNGEIHDGLSLFFRFRIDAKKGLFVLEIEELFNLFYH